MTFNICGIYFALLICSTLSTFNHQRLIPFDDSALEAQYTLNMKHLIIRKQMQIDIVDASTGKQVQTFLTESMITSMHVQSNVVIGEFSGTVSVISPNQILPLFKKNVTSSPVNSVCISGGENFIVTAFGTESLRAFTWKSEDFDQNTTLTNESKGDMILSCNNRKQNEFAVAWSQLNTSNPVFSFYQLSEADQEITFLQDIIVSDSMPNPTYIADLKFHTNADNLDQVYFVGDTPTIYRLNVSSSQHEEFLNSGVQGPLKKLVASSDMLNIATITSTQAVIFYQSSQQHDQLSVQVYVPQTFETESQILAMDRDGGEVLFIPVGANMTAVVESQCEAKTYYYEGSCLTCNSGCQRCSTEGCLNCQDGQFLIDKVCLRCSSGCAICTSRQVCEECSKPFFKSGKVCKCAKGQFINGKVCSSCSDHCEECSSRTKCSKCEAPYQVKDEECKKGPDFIIFILVVGIPGVIMIGIIAINALKLARKPKGKSLLEDQSLDK